ncbi:hypothetical protein FJTKL_02042 [Diaporthe vaccinii]|uniref:Uncharacterized protein n=1 Tax=Diaporthe vaccinii TaxID=105482 RepID=A0ABR4DZ60_9PEZI
MVSKGFSAKDGATAGTSLNGAHDQSQIKDALEFPVMSTKPIYYMKDSISKICMITVRSERLRRNLVEAIIVEQWNIEDLDRRWASVSGTFSQCQPKAFCSGPPRVAFAPYTEIRNHSQVNDILLSMHIDIQESIENGRLMGSSIEGSKRYFPLMRNADLGKKGPSA